MTGWGSAGASVCVYVLLDTSARTHTLHTEQHVLQLLGQAECKLVHSHGHPKDVNEADSDPCPCLSSSPAFLLMSLCPA